MQWAAEMECVGLRVRVAKKKGELYWGNKRRDFFFFGKVWLFFSVFPSCYNLGGGIMEEEVEGVLTGNRWAWDA